MAKSIIKYLIADFIAFNLSYLFAFLLADVAAPGAANAGSAMLRYFSDFPRGFLILILLKIAVFFAASVYRILFEYADRRDYRRIAYAVACATLAAVTGAALFGFSPAVSGLFVLFSFLFDFVFIFGVRIAQVLSPRSGRTAAGRFRPTVRRPVRRVMIVGTAAAAAELIDEMQKDESLRMRPEIFVDENSEHEGAMLLGVETVHGRRDIRILARRRQIDEILIANPGAGRQQTAAVLRECVKTRCRLRQLPTGRGRGLRGREEQQIRIDDFVRPDISDFFGRDRPHVDQKEIGEQIRGRVVLVTGGAGAYGSELCRQIIRYKPRRLIALDADEDALTLLASEIDQISVSPHEPGDPEFRAVIANIRDAETMRRVFSAFRPHLVFHAAELKQISLGQTNPRETFLTDVVGMQICADLAEEFAARKFLLASTRRARSPVGVTAACKRTAEMYILEKNEKSRAAFAAVRFPNLIEARGNVIAVFAKQIAAGGPLTISDKDLTREFVSAEETALLTLQAAAVAEGGEVFEIGPGEPVGIHTLAEAMIRFSGAIPYEDIDIVITQLRPGERLFEDLSPGQLAPVSDRLWRQTQEIGQLPPWPERWYQNPAAMDDAAVVALLGRIFPAHGGPQPPGSATRGIKIENE
ncbi:MAG: polysaccharide biosynthesis protein [Clostridiales bacterium]|nr:polysaccharide biosynthesis protein [Clostridiales bacterium]